MAYNTFMDDMLQNLISSDTSSYYEYYNKDRSISYDSRRGARASTGKMTKAVHLHLNSNSDTDKDYMIMVYTVLLHGDPKIWKISSEGPTSPNPGKALNFDITARAVAGENNWKYIALGVAGPSAGDRDETTMTNYVVAIESYDCGQKSVHSIQDFINQLQANGSPLFMRFSCNGTSMALVNKTILGDYLKFFDNRPFQKYSSPSIRYLNAINNATPAAGNSNHYPYNWLISGAPGTGKSYFIDEESDKLVLGGKTIKELVEDAVNNDHSSVSQDTKKATYTKDYTDFKKKFVKRVTFFEDYTYDSFVGCYKPIVVDNDTAKITFDSKTGEKTESKVSYQFVPGPFIDIYVKAKNDPTHNYCLIIEELNRAKAASVFGDMFQLLDRDDGGSVYSVSPSQELQDYLQEHLNDDGAEDIRLPNNFYIWATMNSADRGVFPIDSAFKRRWVFKCQDVFAPRSAGGEITFFCGGKMEKALFDNFRALINEKIGDDEDKFIGPWYFSNEELSKIEDYHTKVSSGTTCDCSTNPLISKLLLYLRQDIFRNNPDELFYDGNTVSKILHSYGMNYGIEKIMKLSAAEINSIIVPNVSGSTATNNPTTAGSSSVPQQSP